MPKNYLTLDHLSLSILLKQVSDSLTSRTIHLSFHTLSFVRTPVHKFSYSLSSRKTFLYKTTPTNSSLRHQFVRTEILKDTT